MFSCYTPLTDVSNRSGGIQTKAIITINSLHRRAKLISRHAPRVLASAAPYVIGIPLMLAIPAAGIFAGLRLAHDPKFAADKTPLVEPLITAGFFVVGAFFTAVRAFGLLAAIGIAGFLVLAIFLLCAKLVGALAITAVGGDRRQREPAGKQTPANTPELEAPEEEDEAHVADLDMQAFLRR
jgi:hypothetical protein